MGLWFFTVVFDSNDPQMGVRFWKAALERELFATVESDRDHWLPGDPRIDFMKVPEMKATKNRVHLDWAVSDRETTVQRFLELGAARQRGIHERFGEDDMKWTTLADPEGNEFCLIQSDQSMGLRLATIVFDADDLHRVGGFWVAALEREQVHVESDRDHLLPGDPPITFVKVPEGKTTKNRVHLDLYATDLEAEVKRLASLGASYLWHVKNEDFEWTTLADPEGNEFCVVQSEQA